MFENSACPPRWAGNWDASSRGGPWASELEAPPWDFASPVTLHCADDKGTKIAPATRLEGKETENNPVSSGGETTKRTKPGSARWGILCSFVKGGGPLLTDPRGLYKTAGTRATLGQSNVCARVRDAFSFARWSNEKSKRISQLTWV